MYTTDVTNKIKETKNYPLIDLSINVDCTACLLIKYDEHKYYDAKLTYNEMKLSVEALADLIIRRVEAYFNGWAVKKGLRTF
jgi:hypothetical protein